MHQVTIHEAKTQLSKLILEVLAGERVIIARGREPVVELKPIEGRSGARRVGEGAGILLSMADDFDGELDEFSEYR